MLVVLVGITESLIGSELCLNHALQDSVVGELSFEFHELFADLPLVLRFGEVIKVFLAVCFLLILLGFLLLLCQLDLGLSLLTLQLLFLKVCGLSFIIHVLADGGMAILGFVLMSGNPVDEVDLALLLKEFSVV